MLIQRTHTIYICSMMNPTDGSVKTNREQTSIVLHNLLDHLSRGPRVNNELMVLLIISMYRDGLFRNGFVEDAFDFETLLNGWSSSRNEQLVRGYAEVANMFISSAKDSYSAEEFRMLSVITDEFTPEYIKANFAWMFNKVISFSHKKTVNVSRTDFLPHEVSEFMTSVSSVRNYKTIFNPFAGLASFSAHINSDALYIGQELNKQSWALGKLKLMGENIAHEFRNENSVDFWPFTDSVNLKDPKRVGPRYRDKLNTINNQFQFIIGAPPINVKIREFQFNSKRGYCDHYWKHDFRFYGMTIEQFCIHECINSLQENGRGVFLIGEKGLNGGGQDFLFRQKLIDGGFIEAIIQLPSSILFNTNITTFVIILNGDGHHSDTIKMVDGSTFFSSVAGRKRRFNSSALLEAIDSKKGIYSKEIPIHEIVADNYSLLPKRHFLGLLSGDLLKKLLKPAASHLVPTPADAPIVRIKDLRRADDINPSLLMETVNSPTKLPAKVKAIQQSCILIALRGGNLKPTYFFYEGKPVYISNGVAAYSSTSDEVNLNFLVHELRADYVKEQAAAYRTGTTISSLSKSDFLKIRVDLPKIEDQIAKTKALQEVAQEIEGLQKERDDLATGASKERYREFASLKHTLGRPRQNILNWADNIIYYLNQNEEAAAELNSGFMNFYGQGINLLEAAKEIKRDVNFISQLLEKGEDGLVLEKFPLTLTSVREINAEVKKINKGNYNFTLEVDQAREQNLSGLGATINLRLLKTLIENLLTNANKHGFPEKKDENRVIVKLSVVHQSILLSVANNGVPFPRKLEKQQFITKFTTRSKQMGTGIGGYDINRIAEYFGNKDWILVSDERHDFPVQFHFTFNLTPLT